MWAAPVRATVPPPVPVDSVPLEQSEDPAVIAPSPITVPSAVTTLPEGCAPAVEPQIVFVGTVLRVSGTVAVYRVEQVRAGADLGGELGVEYGSDAQFLSSGATYLVGAESDAQTGVLSSKVREERPLFGGDAVLGENDTAANCPTFEDPIRTLNVDGSEIPGSARRHHGEPLAVRARRRIERARCDWVPRRADRVAAFAQRSASGLAAQVTTCEPRLRVRAVR